MTNPKNARGRELSAYICIYKGRTPHETCIIPFKQV